jgi:RimJ/RimL family protein N-acetyltransferase
MLVTPRLRLRRPERAEQGMYARLASEAYRTRAVPLTDVQSRDLATFVVEHWDRYGFGFLIVDVVRNGLPPETVGHAGIRYAGAWLDRWAESYDAIELGYSIIPAARGQGYVTEAARATLAAAFAVFDVSLIRARCNHDNTKSAAVLLRCGMIETEPTAAERHFELARPVPMGPETRRRLS